MTNETSGLSNYKHKYGVIGQVGEGKKLTVGKDKGETLGISSGRNNTRFGQVKQGLARTFTNLTGGKADRESVFTRIQNVNADFRSQVLQSLRNPEEIKAAKDTIIQIEKGLGSIARSYGNEERFKALETEAHKLREEVLALEKASGTSSSENQNEISSPGKRPGAVTRTYHKARDVLGTAGALLRDVVNPVRIKATAQNNDERIALDRVAGRGKQLSDVAISPIIEMFKEQNPDAVIITDFMGGSLSSDKWKDIERGLSETCDRLIPLDKNTSICIPMVMGNDSSFERQHIVLLVIKGDKATYIDSKGLLAEDRKLETSDMTVRDVVNSIISRVRLGAKLEQNEVRYQKDSNSCGACCSYAIEKTLEGKSLQEIQAGIKDDTIGEYRMQLLGRLSTFFDEKKPEPAPPTKYTEADIETID